MNSPKRFTIRWKNSHLNFRSGFSAFLREGVLVDVTLAAEGRILQAHKLILSVCSPYFKQIFVENPCQHPVVILKNIHYKQLSDLLSFMYEGEVSILHNELTALLEAAELLQIKGLSGQETEMTQLAEQIHETSVEQEHEVGQLVEQEDKGNQLDEEELIASQLAEQVYVVNQLDEQEHAGNQLEPENIANQLDEQEHLTIQFDEQEHTTNQIDGQEHVTSQLATQEHETTQLVEEEHEISQFEQQEPEMLHIIKEEPELIQFTEVESDACSIQEHNVCLRKRKPTNSHNVRSAFEPKMLPVRKARSKKPTSNAPFTIGVPSGHGESTVPKKRIKLTAKECKRYEMEENTGAFGNQDPNVPAFVKIEPSAGSEIYTLRNLCASQTKQRRRRKKQNSVHKKKTAFTSTSISTNGVANGSIKAGKHRKTTNTHYLDYLPSTPSKLHARRRCIVCARSGIRKDTIYQCVVCTRSICPNPCFKIYHDSLGISPGSYSNLKPKR